MSITTTIKAGESGKTITLNEGRSMMLKGAPGSAGVAYLLDSALGGTNSKQSWVIGQGALPPIGPYDGQQKILVTCAAGVIDAVVGDAVLAAAISTTLPYGTPGVSKPSGGAAPLIITGKPRSQAGGSGFGLNYQSGGQVNRNVHMVRTARAPFHAVELILFANSGALTVYDHIAVAASARLRNSVPADQITPSGPWTVGPMVTCENTGTDILPVAASTGVLACRSLPRDDGGKYPLFHSRVHTVNGLPGFSSPQNFATAWDAANPDWPMRCFDAGGGDYTSVNQSLFTATTNRNGIIVPGIIKFYYDKAGAINGLGIGDSLMAGTNVNDGSVAGMAYGHRAVRALQDLGLPFDFHNAGKGGNTWAQYAPRGKAAMDLIKPEWVLIPVGTVNESLTTQVEIDAQWRNCMELVRYALALNIIPILTTIWPMEYASAATDSGRRSLNQMAKDSGYYFLDMDASCGTSTSPVRWLPGLCDDLVGVGLGAGNHGNGAAMQKVADEQLAPLLRKIFY